MPFSPFLTVYFYSMAFLAAAAAGVVMNTLFPKIASLRRTTTGVAAIWVGIVGGGSIGKACGYW